jgi:hypothetical protein
MYFIPIYCILSNCLAFDLYYVTLILKKISELVTVYCYFDLMQRKEENCDVYHLQYFIKNKILKSGKALK